MVIRIFFYYQTYLFSSCLMLLFVLSSANIGGVLSLFLGFSFLSLFEVLYFLTLRVLMNVWIWRRARPPQTHPSRPTSLWAHRVPHEFNRRTFVN